MVVVLTGGHFMGWIKKDIFHIYLCGYEGYEPLTSGAVLLERLRHVAVQAIDVLEVKVWQEEIIDVLR